MKIIFKIICHWKSQLNHLSKFRLNSGSKIIQQLHKKPKNKPNTPLLQNTASVTITRPEAHQKHGLCNNYTA